MDTYSKIKSYCDERGIKLSTLAQSIGIRSSVFSELKMGRTKTLSVKTLEKIAAYFETPVYVFLESGGQTNETQEIQNELFRKRKLLFDLSEKASEEDLDKIIKIVDTLVGDN